ncbi:MAG: InlB B-repeat-containing protein [Oscillospiraceae bacterium]|nr:InlB B-repeat-containing protein [Oscillospiraceae bacterium]
MTGGSITGNGAKKYGSGVYVTEGGAFAMSGGSITENAATSAILGEGSGVYVSANSTMSLSGVVVITGNTVGDTASNLCLPSGKTVTLTAALTDGASIGVTTAVTPESTDNGIVLITSEDGTTYYVDSAQYFTSDNTAYDVVANSENSAVVLGVQYTIHFNANGGEAIEDMAVVSGGTYKFPTSVLSGYSQAGWYILGSDNTLSGEVYKGGKSLTVYGTEDVTLFMVRAVLAPTVKVKLTTESDVISDGYTYYYPPNSTRFLTATVTEYDGFTYTYSWAKDGETIEGATGSVLTLEGNVSDTGTYTVTVTATSVNDTVVTTNDTAATTTSGTKVTIRQATNALYYDANGGEGGPSNNFSNGVNLTVQCTEPVRDGYTFAGWNTEADGSGDSYWGDDVYSFEATNNNGNGGMKATLYAQWRAISTVTLADMSQTYTGEAITASGAVVTLANGEEYDGEIIYTYYTDEACTQALDGAPVNAGTYYVIASIPETSAVNAAVSDPVALTILEGEFAVTATGYTGAYDGEGHSITVTADGAEIAYSTDGETYSAENPVFTEAGEYTVYYTAHKDNYTDVTGSVSVVISRAAQAVFFAESEVSKTVGDDAFTNALTGAEGAVTYESSNTAVATVDENGGVTIVGAGSATITATVVGTDNYEGAAASYTLTVAEAAAPEEETKIVVNSLAEVPEGLKDIYASAEELIDDMIVQVVASAVGYTEENTIVYDVKLQILDPETGLWRDATEEDFPAEGITVTMAYPEGTDSTYDFTVVHMYTVTSARLNTVAGETETPAVTKGENGLTFTLHGLSPVAIAWKESTASSTAAPTPTATPATSTAAKTGDDANIALWLVLLALCAGGMAAVIVTRSRRRRN